MNYSNLTNLDRRMIQSKHWIENSFLELLKEKEYDTLTIKMITKKAGVSRSTFYRQYTGKYNLLTSVETKCLTEFNTMLKNYQTSNASVETRQKKLTHHLSQFFSTYQCFFQSILNPWIFLRFQKAFCVQVKVIVSKYIISDSVLTEESKNIISDRITYSLFVFITLLEKHSQHHKITDCIPILQRFLDYVLNNNE